MAVLLYISSILSRSPPRSLFSENFATQQCVIIAVGVEPACLKWKMKYNMMDHAWAVARIRRARVRSINIVKSSIDRDIRIILRGIHRSVIEFLNYF